MNILNIIAKMDTSQLKQGAQQIGDLKGKLKDLASEIPGVGSAMNALGSVTASFSGVAAGGAAAIIGMGVAAAGAAIALGALGVSMGFQFAEQIDAMEDLGEKLGITGDQAFYLDAAMKGAGSSAEVLLNAQDKLAKSMIKSGDESKGAGEAFKRLGVETTSANGTLRNTTEILGELAEKHKAGNMTTGEAADLALVLGKNYREVLFAASEAEKGQQAYNEMMEAGIGVTQEAKDASGQMGDDQLKTGAIMRAVGGIMVEIVIPAFNDLVGWFIKSYKEGGTVATIFNIIANSTKVLVEVISFLAKALGIVIDLMIDAGRVGQTVFKGIAAAINGDFAEAGTLFSAGFDKAISGVGNSIKRTVELVKTDIPKIGDAIGGLLTNRDFVQESKDKVRSQTKPGGLIVPTNAAGGTANEVKEAKTPKEKESEIEKLIKQLQGQALATENLNKVELVAAELRDKRFKDATQEQRNIALGIATKIDDANRTKQLNDATRATLKISQDYVNSIEDEISARFKSDRQIKEDVEIRKIEQKTEEDRQKLREKGLLNLQAETTLMEAQAKAIDGVRTGSKRAKDAQQDWLGNGMQDYIKNLGTVEEASTRFVSNGLNAIEDSFVSLFSTGDFGFKNLVKTILEGLTRMFIQFTIMKPLMDNFKEFLTSSGSSTGAVSGSGGILGLLGSLGTSLFGGKATGGDVQGGIPLNVGEMGPEVFIPKSAGTIVPNYALGGGGTNYSIVVNGADKPEETARQVQAAVMKTMKGEIRRELADQQRSGNSLNRGRF